MMFYQDTPERRRVVRRYFWATLLVAAILGALLGLVLSWLI